MKQSIASPSTGSAGLYRWYVLALATLTFTLVMGMPTMSLPVLFPEIAAELQMTIVQVVVWGVGSLTGIVMGLLGGIIGDWIGAQRTLLIFCALIGVAGAARGFANGYSTLLLTVFLLGLATPVVPTNIHKTCGIWFPGRRLGLANGIVSTGMALGFMLGSLLSATVLSPWLGGWRNVLFFYGAIALLFSMLWATTQSTPDATADRAERATRLPLRQGLRQVVGLRNVWLLGLALFGISGAIQGTLGYLPSYLRAVGWEAATADSALASFHGTSMLFAIPLAMLSDRLGKRRQLLLVATLLIATGFGLLTVVDGSLVWLAVIIAGLTRDGFMAIFMTQVIEVDGVGARHAGTATGLTLGCAMVGNVIAPPLGNSLERLGLSLPFALWTGLVLLGMVALYFVRE
ncbi:MAG: MFS transporter [Caldilineaceae bacterium]